MALLVYLYPANIDAPYVSAAAERRAILRASAGSLLALFITLDPTATARWLQAHNTTALGSIATGTLITPLALIQPGASVTFDTILIDARRFTSGVAIALSTAFATYTDTNANEAFFVVLTGP